MLRPDHIWFFFTVMLSLALAMSIPPRRPERQNQANLHNQIGEQSTPKVKNPWPPGCRTVRASFIPAASPWCGRGG